MANEAGWMEQIARMKDEMIRAQEELAGERITISAGGEAIKVVIDGQQRLQQLTISPQALVASQTDAQTLQNLLVLAINQAIEQSQALAAERLQGLTGSLNLPGS